MTSGPLIGLLGLLEIGGLELAGLGKTLTSMENLSGQIA
jgi:hypothetical protein